MRISWADLAANSAAKTSNLTAPSRPVYVPPHLRNRGASPAPNNNERSRAPNGWGNQRDRREVNPFEDEVEEEQENWGINFDAYEEIPVETSGENVPPPVNTFAEIDLGEALHHNIRRSNKVTKVVTEDRTEQEEERVLQLFRFTFYAFEQTNTYNTKQEMRYDAGKGNSVLISYLSLASTPTQRERFAFVFQFLLCSSIYETAKDQRQITVHKGYPRRLVIINKLEESLSSSIAANICDAAGVTEYSLNKALRNSVRCILMADDKRMSAEIDSTSAPEPLKMSGTSSAATTSGQKLSIFAAKSGFVIPKNKLSGSLVPIFRGAKKHGLTGAINEESSKQIERRSKWGPDLTQDATVRRGKALALQIRVDQITKQLESEKLEVVNTQNLPLVAENPDQSKSGHQINSKKSEMLELEKQEAIGEILKLDPSYKPPRGFKPLLKEASIPLPVQEYPGYNFVGLIYGSEGDNKKQLEKETGAKIKIHGTKADSGEKGEIRPGTDIQCCYNEMHVNISADSFEKVDAATSIIELLVTSLTGNLAAGSTPSISVSRDNIHVLSQSQEGPSSHADSLSLESQLVLEPVAVTQMQGDNFKCSSPWFSASHTPEFALSCSVDLPNPLDIARAAHFPSQTSNTVSSFGAQPGNVAGFQPTIPSQHISMKAPLARQILQYSHMTQTSPLGHIGPPRNPSIVSVQNLSTPSNASLSFPVTLSQPTPIGQLQTSVSSMHLPISGISPSPIPNQPMTHLGVSFGQNEAPGTVKMSVGPNNMGPMAPPGRLVSVHQQPDVSFKPPQSNMSMMLRSASFPPHQVGISPGPPSPLRPMLVPIPAPTHSSVNNLSRPVSFPSPGISPSLPLPQQAGIPNSVSGVAPYQPRVKPPVSATSKSVNFTFQSHPPNTDYGQVVSGPNSQVAQEPPSGPRPPPFGFALPDQPLQMFPRTQFPGQVDQAIPIGGRSGSISNSIPAPRHAAFPYAGQHAPRSAVPQMGMKNFISAPHIPNLTSTGAQRGRSIRQSYPGQTARPDIPMLPNHFVNNPPLASGKLAYAADQIYDPFSPTSAPPQQTGNPGK
ncbi:hypothetical protein VNO78_28551 [Psophocarpus tetragonolobus]|uniref:K Homology domain-containing protein n=1 Tax=Psophocarpus tetragonolobus TaxID=3891 RepID=A0AAN9S2R4_PSOTE